MMFAGTYHSDFYRKVRNLLHDEITRPGSIDVGERWDELLGSEVHYRQSQAAAREDLRAELRAPPRVARQQPRP
jgi:hypothetical protein